MIAKLRPALAGSSAIRMRAGSEWVTLRLDIGSDIDLLATLVSAALAAGARADAEPGGGRVRVPAPCTRLGKPAAAVLSGCL